MQRSDHYHDQLEVHGFDLLAAVEAMLRHAREYQREVQRLRGVLGRGQTSTSDRPPLEAIREQVHRLRRCWREFGGTLDEVDQLAVAVRPPARPRVRKRH